MTAALEPPTFRRPPSWSAQARCAGMAAPDLDPWSAPTDDDLTPDVRARLIGIAKQTCAGCPVRGLCLDDALATGEAFMVRGGTTPAERRALAADRGLPRPSAAGAWQHSTNSGYAAHGCRCNGCTRAHAHAVAQQRQRRRWVATSRGVLIPFRTLDRPTGRGSRRVWPGQLEIAWEAAS